MKKLLNNRFLIYKIFIIIFLIFLDLASKQLVFYFIKLNNFISITSFFEIVHIHNFGISFGFLSGLYPPWIFICMAILVIFFIFFMYLQSRNNIEKWCLTVIFAGGLSNIIDRILNGYVIDFISLHFKEFYWPTFNFADIYISIGVCIIILQLLYDLHKKFIK